MFLRWNVNLLEKKWTVQFFCLIISLKQMYGADCPSDCSCQNVRNNNGSALAIKVKCGIEDRRAFFFEKLATLSKDVISLELTGFNLPLLTNNSFNKFPNLRRLIIKDNRIKSIENEAFSTLSHLQKLDISHNELKSLNSTVFDGLIAVTSLNLSYNNIQRMRNNTFSDLLSVKKIEMYGNDLVCDCHISWIISWLKISSARIKPVNICSHPPALRDVSIKKLSTRSLGCYLPFHSSKFDIFPRGMEVIFEGDSIQLSCVILTTNASYKIIWLHNNNSELSNEFVHVSHEFHDPGVLISNFTIKKIMPSHDGFWECLIPNITGNFSRKVKLIVINDSTKFCSPTVITNEKGTYAWPETIVNFTIKLPCEIFNNIQGAKEVSLPSYAYKTCSNSGSWENTNTDSCPYLSDVTRNLYDMAKANFTPNLETLHKLAFLKNYTSSFLYALEEKDIYYIAEILHKYSGISLYSQTIGQVVLDIVSLIGSANDKILTSSQLFYGSCSILINSLLTASQDILEFQKSKKNLAVESFLVKFESFVGLVCNLFDVDNLLRFRCYQTNATKVQSSTEAQTLLGSIQIPPTLLYQLHSAGHHINPTHKIQFMGLLDGRLLPFVDELEDNNSKSSVVSSVIGVVLDNDMSIMSGFNLSEPVYITLKVHNSSKFHLRPVWWDHTASSGKGAWKSEGCHILQTALNTVFYQCNKLGLFSLIDNGSAYNPNRAAAKFRLSYPAIYVGTAVALLCLIPAIVIYTIYHEKIEMSKKTKHSLPNSWIALLFGTTIFCLGIRQTENQLVCQSVGLLLHYTSLCYLLWTLIITWDLYKQLTNNSLSDQVKQLSENSDSEQIPVAKPIFKHYLIGWGISMIICGVSGAVLLKKYSNVYWCFLDFQSSCAAVFIPAGILVFLLYIFFILIRCVVISNDNNGRYSETTQVTEIELLESSVNNSNTTPAVARDPSTSFSCETNQGDGVRSPLSLLHSHLFVVHLYLLCWVSGALSVLEPILPHQEVIFSCIYGLLLSVLSLFIIFYYCLSRHDIINVWKSTWIGQACKKKSTIVNVPSPIVPTYFTSRSYAQSDSGEKPVAITKCNRNPSFTGKSIGTPKVSNLSIDSPRVTETIFYNPQQSTVAKEFFQRQKLRSIKHEFSGDAISFTALKHTRPGLNTTFSSSAPGLFGGAHRSNNAAYLSKYKYIKERQPLITSKHNRLLKERYKPGFIMEYDSWCTEMEPELKSFSRNSETIVNQSGTSHDTGHSVSKIKFHYDRESRGKMINSHRSYPKVDQSSDCVGPESFISIKYPRNRSKSKNFDKKRCHSSNLSDMKDTRAKSDTVVIKSRKHRRRGRTKGSDFSKVAGRKVDSDRPRTLAGASKHIIHKKVQSSSEVFDSSGESSKKKVETSV